ncbi:MAG TPA: short-chain dehydrogenase/reductase SDR [Myxococcales bacterium]|nr:short-chain dehydrogenase/reductase SDR [Deltaproteobacteria bacterium]HAA56770.1 short-chain dehydrogenase/reductase SDR [Myxococcales bacterium]|tara:strand:- start:283 stop:1203 length:921 start_codon:yes stop_codon:yes gene_type:complete
MSLVSLLKGKGPSGFGYGSTAEDVTQGIDLSGKTFLLTGCNSGLGLETLRVLSLRGAHVIAAARSVEKAENAIKQISANATPVACELSEPASVRACVQRVKSLGHPLDGIICNAGIMALPTLEQKYGHELQFFTNHIGHFILVTGLLDQLTDDARVVMVSSEAHRGAYKEGIQFDNLSGEKGYTPWGAYGQSKLANILFARRLAKNFEGTGKTAYSLHPGVIQTNLSRHMNPIVRNILFPVASVIAFKSIPQGAATSCYLATRPGVEAYSGQYFSDSNPKQPTKHGLDDVMADQLWVVSESIASNV